jgi:tRNA-dihydrouridine synthase B
MNQLLEALKNNPFVLAPMAGITDHAFRSYMKSLDAGVVVTELVSAVGLDYGSPKTLRLTSFDETQRPVGVQLFGEDPGMLAKAARFVQNQGADFVDLNFGCPVPKVVKKGAGSAVLKDLPALKSILSAVKAAIDIPLTIKIRTGWDANTRNADEVCHIAYNEGVTWVAIHGRTRAQGYSGEADWDFIAEVKSKSQIAVLGNGDIYSAPNAVQRLQSSNCDGVLIGRGCLKNPLIFHQAYRLWRGEEVDLVKRNLAFQFMRLKEHIVAHCEPHLQNIQLRKFAAWYSSGYPGAAQFRKAVFQFQTTDELVLAAYDFFNRVDQMEPEDTSKEAFLMGGHG